MLKIIFVTRFIEYAFVGVPSVLTCWSSWAENWLSCIKDRSAIEAAIHWSTAINWGSTARPWMSVLTTSRALSAGPCSLSTRTAPARTKHTRSAHTYTQKPSQQIVYFSKPVPTLSLLTRPDPELCLSSSVDPHGACLTVRRLGTWINSLVALTGACWRCLAK